MSHTRRLDDASMSNKKDPAYDTVTAGRRRWRVAPRLRISVLYAIVLTFGVESGKANKPVKVRCRTQRGIMQSERYESVDIPLCELI